MGRRAFYAEGPLSDRPPARREGLIYYAMDEDATYMDDGSTWAVLHAEQEPAPRHIVYDQFIPGTLQSTSSLAVIANPTDGLVVLRELEANLEKPPGTVNSSNNLVLDVYGTISGLAELPLNANGVSRFSLDTAGVMIEGDITIGLSQIGNPGANPGSDLNISLRAELDLVPAEISGILVDSIPAPNDSPTGLTWDDTHLWCASWPYIYRINPADGAILQQIDAPSNGATGLAWDGTYLWNADFGTDLIYRLDPANGTILQQFAAPGTYPTGLAWDGNHLWVADNDDQQIYELDPDDGSVSWQVSSPATFPTGLAWDGLYLWSANYNNQTIYKLHPRSGAVVQQFTAPWVSPWPWGLTWDGNNLWGADDVSDNIYKLS